MTMTLDKRIKDPTKIFNCFSTEEARAYLGKTGYFADRFSDFEFVTKCCFQILDDVKEQSSPFSTGFGDIYRQFFLPAEFVEGHESSKKKKKWRPFTLDEFRAKFPLFSPVTFRRKTNGELRTYCFIGYIASGTIILGNDWRRFDNLFEDYELQDKDGNWTPFGVEE